LLQNSRILPIERFALPLWITKFFVTKVLAFLEIEIGNYGVDPRLGNLKGANISIFSIKKDSL
jgi:hypothetical protein